MNNGKTRDPVKRCAFFGILFISVLGSLMHFLYDFSGRSLIIGMISPINESVWEHLKLVFLPTILWWALSYIHLKTLNIPFSRWFFTCVVSLLICPLFIVSFYYTYTGAFGVHSLLLDISSLYLGVTIAQVTALHIYRYAKLRPYHSYLAAFIFTAFIAAFVIFTLTPANIPLFSVHLQ